MWSERQVSERVGGCAIIAAMVAIVAMVGGWLGMVVGGLLVVVAP